MVWSSGVQRRVEMYMGPNFLTQPDPTKYPTDTTQSDPRIFGIIYKKTANNLFNVV